jgi:hypothetical protein
MLSYIVEDPIESTSLPVFQNSDEVSLVEGPHKGTLGAFLNLKGDDSKWADVLERIGYVRSHAVEWLGRTRA